MTLILKIIGFLIGIYNLFHKQGNKELEKKEKELKDAQENRRIALYNGDFGLANRYNTDCERLQRERNDILDRQQRDKAIS